MARKRWTGADRVAVATDALAWLDAGRLVADHTYVEPTHDKNASTLFFGADANSQLRDLVLGRCQVCAKGALFLAKVVRFDRCTVGDFRQAEWGDNVIVDGLFSPKQWKLIEAVYEGRDYFTDHADLWVDRYPASKARLRALLANIIRHRGEFVPTDLTPPPPPAKRARP